MLKGKSIFLGLLAAAGLMLGGAEKEIPLVRNGGFETPFASPWRIAHNVPHPAVRVEIDKTEPFEGQASLKVTLTDKLKVYSSVTQSVTLDKTMPLPKLVSIAYKGNQKVHFLMRYTCRQDGKTFSRYESFFLYPTHAWKVYRFPLKVPKEASMHTVEIRVTEPGIYHFDALKFIPDPEKNPAALLLVPIFQTGSPVARNQIYRNMSLPGREVTQMLQKEGFEIEVGSYSDRLDLDFLKQFNVVVLGCEAESYQRLPSVDRLKRLNDLLLEYVKEGGSLLVFRTPGWCFGRDIDYFNSLLEPTGIRILNEQVTDRSKLQKTISEAKFYWTDNITPHEITKDVRGFFYPDTYSDGYASYTDFTSPVEADPDWKILIRGAKSASSYSRAKGQPLQPEKPGTYTAEPPILAVRDYGKGRIAVLPVTTSIFWQDGFHIFWERGAFMNGTFHGKHGDALKLVDNLFRWAAEPSRNVFGGYVVPPPENKTEAGFAAINWEKDRFTGNFMPRCYKGLIGASSSFSDGKASPEEMIDAARKAGYDFLAFTEDLGKINQEKFEKLKDICEKESKGNFQAYPGLRYQDDSGNWWAAFSNTIFWPKEAWFSTMHPGRLKINNSTTRAWNWPAVILLKRHSNPEKPFLQGNFNALSVYTFENGKEIDNSFDTCLELSRECFSFSSVAVHLVDSPAEVKKAVENGFQTYINFVDNHVIEGFSGTYSRCRGQFIYVRPSFISEGPLIQDFRILNFGLSDLSLPGNNRWRMHIKASAPDGIREIRVITTDNRLFRRFLPGGVTGFETQVDGFHAGNTRYFLEVTDQKGHRALSSPILTGVQENCFMRCSDNLNTMPRGKWWGQPEKLLNIRGFEDYLAVRDFTYTGTPSFEGLGNAGKFFGIEYIPELSSRFGNIILTRINDYYPNSRNGNLDVTDVQDRALPNELFRAEVKYTAFSARGIGPLVYLVEGEINILRDFSSDGLRIFWHHGRKTANQIAFTRPDGKIESGVLGPDRKNIRGNLPEKGFAALSSDAFRGSVGFVALSPGISFDARMTGDQGWFALYGWLNSGKKQYRKGDKITYRYLNVVSRLDPEPGDGFIRSVIDKLGLHGKTAYRVSPENGTVGSDEFILWLNARNNAWDGVITQAELPLNLPVMISGLNPNWDAGILYKGKNKLLIPEWIVNEYQQRFIRMTPKEYTDELYHIPVMENGTGMLQVDTEFGDRNIFIGNLLTADNTDIRLTLLDSRSGKQAFEAHNPTDKPITCTVKPGKGFGLLGEFTRKITVPAGSSLRVALQ